jgi:2-dehydropantoate 2-reductase
LQYNTTVINQLLYFRIPLYFINKTRINFTETEKKMKILIFGRGVIGSQYAWALEQAGHDITFYVREGRIQQYKEEIKLNILDARKKLQGIKINETWKVKMIDKLPPTHDFNLILLSVQHYNLKDSLQYLSDKMGNAKLLIYNNVWEEPADLERLMPADTVVWGFPGAGGGFDENDILNGALLGRFTFGTFKKEPKPYQLEIRKIFADAGFKIDEQKDFRSWLYVHFILNASMHLQNLQSTSTYKVLTSYKQWKEILKNGEELMPLLDARNVEYQNISEMKLLKLPPWIVGLVMPLAFKFVRPLKAVITGHSNTVELKSFLKDVVFTAKALKIELPRFGHQIL